MRRQILHELKLSLMVTGIGAAIFASMLFFGLRAKAQTVRDGVHTPVLQTMDRAELMDMRAGADYEAVQEAVLEDEVGTEAVAAVYTQSDLDLLAALVWAEAGDQPFDGMRVVADCVCNRASDRHPEWPSTISEVIYQPGQFSVVADGRLDQGFYNATPECYEAARLALIGDHYDTQVIYFSMYCCANGQFAYQIGDHFIGY